MSVKKSKNSRPRIWADGSQNPPFQIRTFAAASLILARDSLSGLLSRCSDSASGFGNQIASGRWRVPEERLGRSGHFLPNVRQMAATIRGASDVLGRAARIVAQEVEDVPQPEASTLFAPRRSAPRAEAEVVVTEAAPARAARPAAAAPPAPSDDNELAAIRAMLQAEEPIPAPRRARLLPQLSAPVPGPAEPRPRADYRWRLDWITDQLARVLGYGLLAMSLPVGAGLAVLAHAKGKDLRRITED